MSPAPGINVGPYRIDALIGAGGMGSVYRARDTRLDRTVAIKFVEGRFSERFEREAKIIASLNHPHICTLHDVGENYLVMEYIEGTPLSGPLPWNEVVRLGAQIAGALDEAHRKGITHRDLKPGNVLVSKSGVKVIDFGLAKTGPVVRGELDATLTKPLTGEGAIVGTICYMAPEQLQGQEADARSDIFAMGCVLYEMVTGRRAFEGQSPVSIMAAILEHEPAPLTGAAVPGWLDRLIRRCLRKNPDDRWQSARDVAIELCDPPSAVATLPPAQRAWKWVWAAAALAALASALATFAVVRHTPPNNRPAGAVRFEVVAPGSDGLNYPQISPDGSRISFSTTTDGRPRLWVRSLATPEPQPVPHSEGGDSGIFSPDGRWLAFRSDGQLKKVDLQKGSVEILGEWGNSAPFASWSGHGILIPGIKGITWFSDAGGVPRVIIPNRANGGVIDALHPSFLPDGRRFLYYLSTGPEHGICLGSIDEPNPKSPRFLFSSESSGIAVVGEENRLYLLFARNQSLMAQPVRADTLAPEGNAIILISGFSVGNNYLTVGASRNGVLVYQMSPLFRTKQVVWFDRKGNPLREAAPPGPFGNLSLSPDDSRAAVVSYGAGSVTQADVWIVDLLRGTSSRLTLDAAGNQWPVWTPDGRQISFWKRRAGKIFTMPVAGGDAVEMPLSGNSNKVSNQWSRDGKRFLYTSGAHDLMVYDTETRQAVNLGGSNLFAFVNGQFSPDGHWVAYQSDESGTPQVFVTSFPPGSGKFTISARSGVQPRWRSDGRELFYLSGAKLMSVAIRQNGAALEAGVPQDLFTLPPGVNARANRYYDVAADGQRFLMLVDEQRSGKTPITVLENWTAGFDLKPSAAQ